MRAFTFCSMIFLLTALCAAAGAQGTAGTNWPSQRDKPILLLISIDGFRWDYQDRFDTPALDRIAASGVRSEALIPVFPTLTFPNHYSIATGLYPAKHCLIGNTFPDAQRQDWYSLYDRSSVEDGRWYCGDPIWALAERNGLVAAAYYFVGTEAEIGGVRPSHWKSFDPDVSGAARVDQVLEWLALPADRRPHLITLYFEDVDVASHDFGPDSADNRKAVERVDAYLARLLDGLHRTPVADDTYLLLVSDHGQAAYREAEDFVIESVADLDGIMPVDHGSVAFLYFERPDAARAAAIRDAVNAAWAHGRALLPEEAPDAWRLGARNGIADVIVMADLGYAVRSRRDWRGSSIGDHGWAPEEKAMHGFFLASGPRLPAGRRIGAVSAVDVYPLMLEILGLPVPGVIDSDRALLPRLLSD